VRLIFISLRSPPLPPFSLFLSTPSLMSKQFPRPYFPSFYPSSIFISSAPSTQYLSHPSPYIFLSGLHCRLCILTTAADSLGLHRILAVA
jgi:hypothetical protein